MPPLPPMPPHLLMLLVSSAIVAGSIAALAIMVLTRNQATGRAVETQSHKEESGVNLKDGLTPVDLSAALARAPAVSTEPSALVQTMTKTFAQLSVGIGIFDKAGNLILFNPALMELTTLPVTTLSRKPTITQFLDEMRSRGMLPEPRDYTDWRARFEGLPLEASGSGNDLLDELWCLPSGQTYRVTAQAYRNGAVALLMEDISSELSATRGIRSRIRQNESTLNSFEEPICVFAEDGRLSFSNRAFNSVWASLTDERPTRLDQALALWRNASGNCGFWDDVESYATQVSDREPWSFRTRMGGLASALVRVTPVVGGGIMIRLDDRAVSTPQRMAPISRLQAANSQSIFAVDGTHI